MAAGEHDRLEASSVVGLRLTYRWRCDTGRRSLQCDLPPGGRHDMTCEDLRVESVGVRSSKGGVGNNMESNGSQLPARRVCADNLRDLLAELV